MKSLNLIRHELYLGKEPLNLDPDCYRTDDHVRINNHP